MGLCQTLHHLVCIRIGDQGDVLRFAERTVRTAGVDKLQTVLIQFEALYHLSAKDEQGPCAHVVLEPIKQLSGSRHTSNPAVLLNAQNREPILGENRCCCESVVTCTYNNCIIVSHFKTPLYK
ncbi:hypothetical protein ES703_59202 [subsurface metagenome]